MIDKISKRAQLEQSYRNYAAVFDNVKIVINKSQQRDHYLNFPYVCNYENSKDVNDISTLIQDASSDSIFIGHSGLVDFPITILSNLLKSYNGELFMGYDTNNQSHNNLPFGIYHKNIVSKKTENIKIDSLDEDSYTLLPIPESSICLF